MVHFVPCPARGSIASPITLPRERLIFTLNLWLRGIVGLKLSCVGERVQGSGIIKVTMQTLLKPCYEGTYSADLAPCPRRLERDFGFLLRFFD